MPNHSKRLNCAALTLAAFAAVCLLFAANVRAQPASKNYRKLTNQGVDEYNRAAMSGNYAKAKKLFKQAIKIDKKRPGPYRYLAAIADNENDWKECLEQSAAYGARISTGKNIGKIRKLHKKCRKKLGKPDFLGTFTAGRGAIHVSSDPSSAKVKLNGLTLGATPLGPREFSSGKVDIEVSLNGYLPAKTSAEVVEGFVTDVHVDLKKDPNAKVGSGTKTNGDDVRTGWITIKLNPGGAALTFDGKPPTIGEDGRIETTPGLHETRANAVGYEPWGRRVRVAKGQHRVLTVNLRKTSARNADRKKGYMFLAAATLAGGLGVAFGILENKAFEEALDIQQTEASRPTSGMTEVLQPIRTRQDLADARSLGGTYKLLQMASIGAAAVALGLSIYYFVKERPDERKGAPLPVVITPVLPTGAIAGVGAQITYTKRLDW